MTMLSKTLAKQLFTLIKCISTDQKFKKNDQETGFIFIFFHSTTSVSILIDSTLAVREPSGLRVINADPMSRLALITPDFKI